MMSNHTDSKNLKNFIENLKWVLTPLEEFRILSALSKELKEQESKGEGEIKNVIIDEIDKRIAQLKKEHGFLKKIAEGNPTKKILGPDPFEEDIIQKLKNSILRGSKST